KFVTTSRTFLGQEIDMTNNIDLHDLLVDIEALKLTMETVMNGRTEDHAKWVSYKKFTQAYSDISRKYCMATNDLLPIYKSENLKDHMSTVWPIQKEIFETIYSDVLVLYGRLKKRLPNGTPTG